MTVYVMPTGATDSIPAELVDGLFDELTNIFCVDRKPDTVREVFWGDKKPFCIQAGDTYVTAVSEHSTVWVVPDYEYCESQEDLDECLSFVSEFLKDWSNDELGGFSQ